MNSRESSLWKMLKGHMPSSWDVQRIETGSTGRGIPDVNVCVDGHEFWIELKVVQGRRVELSPEQVAWHYRRTRAGGRTWILARDKADGVWKGKYDRLYLWSGDKAPEVFSKGIEAPGAVTWAAPFAWEALLRALSVR